MLIFPETKLNIGNDYDTTTGQFTCRYPGIYVFSVNLYCSDAGNRVKCHIMKNRGTVSFANTPSFAKWLEGSGSTIVHLELGDKVYVGSCVGADNILDRTTFNGFLLQAD